MFGGSFDPVTSSHLKMAAEIIHTGAADEVWLVRNKSDVVFLVAGLLTVSICDMYIVSAPLLQTTGTMWESVGQTFVDTSARPIHHVSNSSDHHVFPKFSHPCV